MNRSVLESRSIDNVISEIEQLQDKINSRIKFLVQYIDKTRKLEEENTILKNSVNKLYQSISFYQKLFSNLENNNFIEVKNYSVQEIIYKYEFLKHNISSLFDSLNLSNLSVQEYDSITHAISSFFTINILNYLKKNMINKSEDMNVLKEKWEENTMFFVKKLEYDFKNHVQSKTGFVFDFANLKNIVPMIIESVNLALNMELARPKIRYFVPKEGSYYDQIKHKLYDENKNTNITQTRFPGIKTVDTFTNQENILVKAIVYTL